MARPVARCLHCRRKRSIQGRGLCCTCYRHRRDAYPQLQDRHQWNMGEVKVLRENYGRMKWVEVAKLLDKRVGQVMAMAHRLGIRKPKKVELTVQLRARLSWMVHKGWSIQMMVEELDLHKETINRMLRETGLEPKTRHGTTRVVMQRRRWALKEWLAKRGRRHLAEFLNEKTKSEAVACHGWPQANSITESWVMETLYEHGPSTYLELRSEARLMSRNPLTRLCNRGVVVRLGRVPPTGRMVFSLADSMCRGGWYQI